MERALRFLQEGKNSFSLSPPALVLITGNVFAHGRSAAPAHSGVPRCPADPQAQQTPLHRAAIAGHVDCLQPLVEAGADINAEAVRAA